MNFDEFTGEIQHRLELPGTGETVRAIRATLITTSALPRSASRNTTRVPTSIPNVIPRIITAASV
jgi:hypothetical protein